MKKENEHYVNNAEFSQAIVDYCSKCKEYREQGKPDPMVPNYIAECLLKIAEGLSHKSNFIQYTYREEMVMDAVENCLKAVQNYDIDKATRTGKPNAFAYFTQISWYAFLRRIEKEKKQQDVKFRYMAQSGIEEFMVDANEDPEAAKAVQSFVDGLRQRIDDVRENSSSEDYKRTKPRERIREDSDLMDFFEEVNDE